MKQFPPETWKPERSDEIKRRIIILSVQPSKEEAAFMESYDLWLEGYRLWERAQGAAAPKKAGASKTDEPKADEKAGKSTKPDVSEMRNKSR
jgi:hypothetical protein